LLVSLLAVFAISAIASASASAFKLEWETATCAKVAPGTGEFEDSECNTLKAGGEFAFSWKALGATETKNVETESQAAEYKLTAGGKVITCKNISSAGTITGTKPGTGEATTITFGECTTTEALCKVKSAGSPNGTIVVKNVTIKLVEREPNGGGAKKLAAQFTENATTKEFVTLKFEGTCPNYPETKVLGQVAAEVINLTTGEEIGDGELNFPSPELKGNTLKAFGVAAKLTGKSIQELVEGQGEGMRAV
jgi:hypothetical protein